MLVQEKGLDPRLAVIFTNHLDDHRRSHLFHIMPQPPTTIEDDAEETEEAYPFSQYTFRRSTYAMPLHSTSVSSLRARHHMFRGPIVGCWTLVRCFLFFGHTGTP